MEVGVGDPQVIEPDRSRVDMVVDWDRSPEDHWGAEDRTFVGGGKGEERKRMR